MDTHLTKNEQKLQYLLLSKDFSSLSTSEKSFVLSISSESEYKLEREVIKSANKLFDDLKTAKPLPLVIPSLKKDNHKQIPFYQALLMVAATIAIMFFVLPFKSNNNNRNNSKTQYIVKTDTVEIQKEVLMHDTIYKIIEKPVYINKEVIVKSDLCVESIKEEPRLFKKSNSDAITTQLFESTLTNKGTSLKDDNVKSLVLEYAPNLGN